MHARRRRRGLWTVMLLAGCRGVLAAEEEKAPAAPVAVSFHAAEPVNELTLTRTALARLLPGSPVVDGQPGEAAWESASTLNPLCFVGGAQPATPRTIAMAGHCDGVLYIAVACDEPDPKRRKGIARTRDRSFEEEDCVQILLDATLERGPVKVVSVNPAGAVTDYAAAGGRRDMSWNIECVAACAETATGWAAEIAVPRRALDDPLNDVIGFNIVRRRPGTEGEPFSWNPAPEVYEYGGAMGSLAFQQRDVTVRKVELGWPHVGANAIRVWLKNETAEERVVRAGLATRAERQAADISRYLLKIPPAGTRIYALSHRIRNPGRTDLALALTDHETGAPLARVSRPGLAAAPSALVLTPDAQGDRTGVAPAFRILLPKRELTGVSVLALLRHPETRRVLGKDGPEHAPSRTGTVRVDTSGLPPGDYRLDVYLERDGKPFASAGCDVTITAPEAAE